MTTFVFRHEACLGHDPGPNHPESPERLTSIYAALADPEFSCLEWREAPAASREQITRVHSARYVDSVYRSIPDSGRVQLDSDTVLSSGTWLAALHAAGAVCAAVDAVVHEEAENAFCAVRPPGHHAKPDRAMGFCIFNNVAIGARQARDVHGISRIAVVDFDVHHGNGTQAVCREDRDLFYASVHQMPLYPGTGKASDHGSFGNIVNAPLPPRSGSTEFRRVVGETILPALVRFEPEFLLVSAGFDGLASDPVADLRLGEDDYGWITMELRAIAQHAACGRLVSVLEGGYDLKVLGAGVGAHVRALINARATPDRLDE